LNSVVPTDFLNSGALWKKLPITTLNKKLQNLLYLNNPTLPHKPHHIASDLQLEHPPHTTQNPPELKKIFDYMLTDVLQSQESIQQLNAGRKILIEKRLEVLEHKHPKKYSTWEIFAAEVTLYNILEISVLKTLEHTQLRPFAASDLHNMNFALYRFFSSYTSDFARDKYSWNFARASLYSWYSPTKPTLISIAHLLDQKNIVWDANNLIKWMLDFSQMPQLSHIGFVQDFESSENIFTLLLNIFSIPSSQPEDLLPKHAQEMRATRSNANPTQYNVFIPSLSTGGIALQYVNQFINLTSPQKPINIYGCSNDNLEIFWIEALVFLKYLNLSKNNLKTIPTFFHALPILALELHPLNQLNLPTFENNRYPTQSSAGQIQQFEKFDLALTINNSNCNKSSRWLHALSEQLPYWKGLISTNTNLNWGELHLYLSLSKLKENGVCIYLSHRKLPDHGDGEKLRKTILSSAVLEYFVELNLEEGNPYPYLYVFRKTTSKIKIDTHKIKFGKWENNTPISLHALQESKCNQLEVLQRGWSQIFSQDKAPLIWHLNHKFPKLYNLCSIQNWSSEAENKNLLSNRLSFFARPTQAFALVACVENHSLKFIPLYSPPPKNKIVLFPHSLDSLAWIKAFLESQPVQIWIQNQITLPPKLQDLRTIPMVDLTKVMSTHKEALDFMQVSKTNLVIEQMLAKYKPLFTCFSTMTEDPIAIQKLHLTMAQMVELKRITFDAIEKRNQNLKILDQLAIPLFEIFEDLRHYLQ